MITASQVAATPTREEWEALGREHVRRERRASWALAYWLVAGRTWDTDFAISASITGYSRPHLWNLFRVAMAFPPGTAHPDLSIAAHRELLRARDDATRLLTLSRAIENQWTADDVVAHFRAHPEQTRRAVTPDPACAQPTKTERSRRDYHGLHVMCPQCQHVFPVRHHKAPAIAANVEDAR